ncbi:cytochrome P450 [Gracilibacillus kekensis]|uniref:Fatty-acid peroxygenase n=1 Tax=Gracilibacillus kekensis TaxID=1027249 RepID=A0A1M7PZE1_9BACI|nr:cytochrome P450 [Gracilibacillus kekensis]SHN23022.1 fatty-acid peroxygenase [Gracilibacillus kekensis]
MIKNNIPQDKGLDHTLQVLKEGYHFIMNRSEKFDSRIFETRLLGEKVICLIGKEHAGLFYDNEKFIRKGAAPGRIQKTLFGLGGVQGLDGREHHHRKAMFMSLMTEDKLKEITTMTQVEWMNEFSGLYQKDVNVYEAAKRVLTRVALRWTGMPSEEDDLEKWVNELSNLFENTAKIGPKHWKARSSRTKAEDFLIEVVKKVRDQRLNVEKDRAVYQFSWHCDSQGDLLDPHTVAVELLNLLRPIVAISVYVDFMLLAIHDFPEETIELKNGNDDELKYFIQEVRRYYPFFPFTTARVKRDFIWNDYRFKKGRLTLLDLYGTNHDPAIWSSPDQFYPSRFESWQGSPFDFIPQGGGEFDIGHRCAGEWITIDILKATLDYFINRIKYDFPVQDFDYSMNQIPSLPKSRIVISNVRNI